MNSIQMRIKETTSVLAGKGAGRKVKSLFAISLLALALFLTSCNRGNSGTFATHFLRLNDKCYPPDLASDDAECKDGSRDRARARLVQACAQDPTLNEELELYIRTANDPYRQVEALNARMECGEDSWVASMNKITASLKKPSYAKFIFEVLSSDDPQKRTAIRSALMESDLERVKNFFKFFEKEIRNKGETSQIQESKLLVKEIAKEISMKGTNMDPKRDQRLKLIIDGCQRLKL